MRLEHREVRRLVIVEARGSIRSCRVEAGWKKRTMLEMLIWEDWAVPALE